MSDPVLRRINQLSIEGFRGFVKATSLNTNADIVLITGPNGFGKTSLLQALQLLLTGHPELDAEHLFGLKSGSSDEAGAEQESWFPIRIRAETRFGPRDPPRGTGPDGQTDGGSRLLQLDWKRGEKRPTFGGGRAGVDGAWPRSFERGGNSGEREVADEEAREAALEKLPRDRETLARVTTFYPERVEDLFRSVTTGTTLRDIFFPMPEAVRVALKQLQDETTLKSVKDKLEQVRRAIRPLEDLERRTREAQRAFAERWHPLSAVMGSLAQRLASVRTDEVELQTLTRLAALPQPTLVELSALTQHLLAGTVLDRGDVVKRLLDTLIGLVDREIVVAKRTTRAVKGAEVLQEEQQTLTQQLQKSEADFPRLDDDLRCFATDAAFSDLPEFLAVLRSVAENTEAWLKRAARLPPEARTQLAGVLSELQAVVPGSARLRAQQLERWLLPRRNAARGREEIKERLAQIERLLEGYRSSEDVRRLSEWKKTIEKARRGVQSAYSDLHQAQRAIELQDDLREAESALEGLRREVEAATETLERLTGANLQILEDVAKLTNEVLSRFTLVPGILPLGVQPLEVQASLRGRDMEAAHSEIRTASGLSLAQLSTGQRAQLAVSFAVAQSELLRASASVDLPFYVLLLDDVSTAYDLSNLTREAALWRQLAYHEQPERRWQLFLTSHHEDMSNHLLDLLVPPAGASLRVLQFKGWSKERGPELEQFWVEPSPELTERAREAIKSTFQEELCRAS